MEHFKHIRGRRLRTIQVLTLLVTDYSFFSFTDPSKVPSVVLILGYLLLALTVYVLCYGLTKVGAVYGLTVSASSRKHFATIATMLITGLSALQSINQLSTRDVIVVVPLALISYVYLTYGSKSETTNA